MGKHKESAAARIAGAGASGIAELFLFHPVDTISKRLMSNRANLSFSTLNAVVFRNYAESGAGRKFLSLFPGLGYAAGYKILQRIYKFGGQPYANDFLNANYKKTFVNLFGEKNGKAMMHATAGSVIGVGEIVLLPLDVLKIKRQTNPEAFRGRGVLRIVADEGFALYRGWGWTAARNAPGSFALFGGSAFTKEYILGLKDYSSATWGQNAIASIMGSVASITISQPLDVIKTRVQNQNFESKVGGFTLVKDLIKHEGVSAFFKGLTPKLLVVAPKLVFSFTIAQTLIPAFGKIM
ncbi:mitochondrial carrier protein [Cystobasidium minutum MCA 4210]|uniref:mitochondrial carrier protein n=1 Tax=Cystobasidium minutum MCA 4210 TaxID=1397322 RepID=UPI0034CEB5C7|eukprot:jgi/Rhomi1/139362/e_gw1.1.151.1